MQNSRRMSIQAIFSHQIMHTVITVGTDCTVYADRVLCKFCTDCEQCTVLKDHSHWTVLKEPCTL